MALIWSERESDPKYSTHADVDGFLYLTVEQWKAEHITWNVRTCSDSGFEDMIIVSGQASTIDEAKTQAIKVAEKLLTDALSEIRPEMVVIPLDLKEGLIKDYQYATALCSNLAQALSKIIVCLQEKDSHLQEWLDRGCALVAEHTGRKPE